MGSPVPALSAREASCLCDALVRLYHLGMVSAFRHVLYLQQSSTQALQHYDELQQRLPVSLSLPLPVKNRSTAHSSRIHTSGLHAHGSQFGWIMSPTACSPRSAVRDGTLYHLLRNGTGQMKMLTETPEKMGGYAEGLRGMMAVQAIQHDAEEVIKWDRAMQRCQQTLTDSARYAAWHSVSISRPLSSPVLIEQSCLISSAMLARPYSYRSCSVCHPLVATAQACGSITDRQPRHWPEIQSYLHTLRIWGYASTL